VLGAETRRKRRRAWIGRAVLATGGVGAAVAVALSDFDFAALQPGLEDLRALRATMTSELEAFHAGRTELEQQREWLEQQSAELASLVIDFDRRAAALEAESADIREQTARLEAALARVNEERQALLAAASEAPREADSIEEIETKQRSLEQQREAFAAKESEVSSELGVLSRRRQELEERRAALEAQRRELEALLNDTGRGASRDAPAVASSPSEASPGAGLREPESMPASDGSAFEADTGFAIASTIGPESLGNMRGGIMLGDGMNVSIGLTRSASINGIEQVTNTLTLDELNRTLGTLGTQSLEPVIIQNGPNNVLDTSFLDGVGAFGTIIQNTLDDQVIGTSTVLDVSITDVSRAMDGVAAGQALRDSLYFQQ